MSFAALLKAASWPSEMVAEQTHEAVRGWVNKVTASVWTGPERRLQAQFQRAPPEEMLGVQGARQEYLPSQLKETPRWPTHLFFYSHSLAVKHGVKQCKPRATGPGRDDSKEVLGLVSGQGVR
jgi:hypothetical protein